MMASTSPLCRADRLVRRGDLVVRPIPEIRMCMVYRPRPARVVTLNPFSWMLFEACDGATVDDIENAVVRAGLEGGKQFRPGEILEGLQQLADLALVTPGGDPILPNLHGATT